MHVSPHRNPPFAVNFKNMWKCALRALQITICLHLSISECMATCKKTHAFILKTCSNVGSACATIHSYLRVTKCRAFWQCAAMWVMLPLPIRLCSYLHLCECASTHTENAWFTTCSHLCVFPESTSTHKKCFAMHLKKSVAKYWTLALLLVFVQKMHTLPHILETLNMLALSLWQGNHNAH